jgi:NitT/TauT family transport system substrate-binding protein
LAAALTFCPWLRPSHAAETLTISLTRTVGSAPIYIALDTGLFRAQGLDVELRFFEGAVPVVMAVAAGDAAIGATVFLPAFYNLAGKGGLKVIAGTNHGKPGFRSHAFLASPRAFEAGFTQVRDFGGRSVGSTAIGSLPHYSVVLVARKYGFDHRSMRIVPLQTISNVVAALKSGQIDGAALPAIVSVAAEARGDVRIIGWVDDEVPWQIGGLFTANRVIRERREVLERFMRAYRQAARAYHDALLVPARGADAAKADAMLQIIAGHAGQSPAQVRKAIAYIDPDGRMDAKDIADQIAFWQSEGHVDKTVDPAQVVDTSFTAVATQ